jgi:[ribosomal protein S5]-alanine N-acetyltransferase
MFHMVGDGALLVLLLLTACSSAPVPVDPNAAAIPLTGTALASIQIPDATIIYYDIDGASAEELRTQLSLLGPVGVDGYKGDATTRWFIHWDWPGYGTSDCEVAQAQISYEIEVVLPRWKMTAKADPGLVSQWAIYMEALIEHEKGHVEYVVPHSASVLDAIRHADCETPEEEANKYSKPSDNTILNMMQLPIMARRKEHDSRKKNMFLLTTERLFLRHFHMRDAEPMARVFGDPEVMRFSEGVRTKEWIQNWLRTCLEHYYPACGFGPYAVVERNNQEVIGYCGLFFFPELGGQAEVEIGYRLARSAWGKGYATEAARAVRDYAFNTLALERLIAMIDPSNLASIRVAEKIGMHYEKDILIGLYASRPCLCDCS